jgi:uncharacterized protein
MEYLENGSLASFLQDGPIPPHEAVRIAKAVATALKVAESSAVDIDFVAEAALLHDIGIRFTAAPSLGCHGELPYLAHGYKGRELLEAEGLPRHALVCDRHIGVGISAAEIRAQGLPLPERDLLPLSIEEEIVAYADLFFSKKPQTLNREKSAAQVRAGLMPFGADKVAIFDAWQLRFGAV